MGSASGPRIFLSHANKDKPRLRELGLIEALGASGCRVFVDRPWEMYAECAPSFVEGLPAAKNWRAELIQAVRISDKVVLCFSSAFVTRVIAESEGLIQELSETLRTRPFLGLHIDGRADLSRFGWARGLFESHQDIVHPEGDMCFGPLVELARWAAPASGYDAALWTELLVHAQRRLATRYRQGNVRMRGKFACGTREVLLVPLRGGKRPYVHITVEPLFGARGEPLQFARDELHRRLGSDIELLPSPEVLNAAFRPVDVAFGSNPFGLQPRGVQIAWARDGQRIVAVCQQTGKLLPNASAAAAWLCM